MDSSSHKTPMMGGGGLVNIVINHRVAQKAMNFWTTSDSVRFSKRPLFLCAAIFLYCLDKFTSYRVNVAQN
jgi:hypothetical protein